MKLFALLALVLASTPVHARSIQAEKEFVFSQVQLNGKDTHQVAVANVNFVKKLITISLYKDPCHNLTAEPGTIHCMAAAMLISSFQAPLQKAGLDSCHTAVYSGLSDQTPADGLRTEIQILDHSTRVCEDVQPYLVVATATIFNPWTNKTAHYEMRK